MPLYYMAPYYKGINAWILHLLKRICVSVCHKKVMELGLALDLQFKQIFGKIHGDQHQMLSTFTNRSTNISNVSSYYVRSPKLERLRRMRRRTLRNVQQFEYTWKWYTLPNRIRFCYVEGIFKLAQYKAWEEAHMLLHILFV